MGFKNVYIYISDALRYDSIPDSIAEEGKAVPTLTPGGYTPVSFTSLVTGKDPRNHEIRSFYGTLETENVFDYFENHCYYDHPEDAMCKNVFKNYTTSKELEEMEEPFFYVERALDTHTPYGQIKHGNEVPPTSPEGETLKERYQVGVKSTEEHFWQHMKQLKERGLYEDTLIIFTSDHGELLGERRAWKERRGHNYPICSELNVVPTIFVNTEVDFERARTIDLVPTALSMIETGVEFETDGIDLTEEQPEDGYSMMVFNTRPLVTTGVNWSWNGEWTPGKSKLKTDIATLALDFFDPVRKKLRNTDIDKLFRPGDRQRQLYSDEPEEVENIDF